MAGETVTAPNNVSSAYEDFLESFRAVVEDSNLTLAAPARPIRSSFVAGADNTEATFTWCMYLRGWPCRRLGRAKRLDVVLKAIESFSRPSWRMTKSTVYVNYIVVVGDSAKLVQALHYDFVDHGQTDHPFFHVQLSDEAIPPADLRASGFEMDLPLPGESNQCWVATRIPTPDMTLASVLYCLVADHLGAPRFAEFSKTVQSIESRLPPPAFDYIKQSLVKFPSHFKSSHWFSHTQIGQVSQNQ
jgi:hypothetical protein